MPDLKVWEIIAVLAGLALAGFSMAQVAIHLVS